MEQERKKKGTLLLWVLSSLLAIFVLCAFARSNYEQRQRNERERGSLAHAQQVQEMMGNFTERNERFLTADELGRVMAQIRPLYKGVPNTRTNLPTEPRTVNSMEPGALIYSVSQDCCTDTIAVVGEDRTVIWTIVGTVGHGYVIYGTTPSRRRENTRPAVGTLPNGEEDH